MSSISQILENDHARCDTLFANAEAGVVKQSWEQASTAFTEFEQAMDRHLAIEEEVLFPAFEQAIGSASGPTFVMRTEHQQLRDIIDTARTALEAHNADNFFAAADILQITMGQHNLKEEGILYPMMDRHLDASIVAELQIMLDRREAERAQT